MAGNRDRPRLTRLVAALTSCAAVIILAALGPAWPAWAAGAARQDVPGSQIAAALRTSPLYIDSSLSSAFPPSARTALLQAIGKTPVPVFVIAVPMVSGGQWANGQQLAGVVQNALGSPGIYLTLDLLPDAVDAFTWPSDPQGLDEPPYHAADAALAAETDMSHAAETPPVWQTILKCIQLIDSGKGESAFQAALTGAASGSTGGQADGSSSGGDAAAGFAVIGVVVAGTSSAAWLAGRGRRRRRRARRAAPGAAPEVLSFTPPPAVVAAARATIEGDLRRRAQQELIELGELVEQPGSAGASAAHAPGTDGDAYFSRALDDYEAASRVLDSAAGIPDLAGVLVLTHLGRCATAAAQAQLAGRAAAPVSFLCYFNPLHGEGVKPVRWRARSGQALSVHACADCAAAVGQRTFPDVLVATAGRLDVPYYEAAGSVWAETGYGQFSTDLAQRIIETWPRCDHG